MIGKILALIGQKVYDWHHRDKVELVKKDFENRWEPLFIETRFDDLEDCKMAIRRSTKGTIGSAFLKDGIIGDIHEDNTFELHLNLARTNRCRYIGAIREINGRYCLVGNVKPKKRVSNLWAVFFPLYSLWVLYVSFNGYTSQSGYSLFYYVFSIFTILMIFPMMFDAILKMDCRKTAKLMGENLYAQLKIKKEVVND